MFFLLPYPHTHTHTHTHRYDWKRFLEGLQHKEEFKDGGRGLNWTAIGVPFL